MGGEHSGKAKETDSTVSWSTFCSLMIKDILVGKTGEKSEDGKCRNKNTLRKERREDGDSKKERTNLND